MKSIIALSTILLTFNTFALENCLDSLGNENGAVYQCDGDVTSKSINTYYTSSKRGARVDKAMVCLFEKSLNIDYGTDDYVPELLYRAIISYPSMVVGIDREFKSTRTRVSLRPDNSFVHGKGSFKLREAKNDPNIHNEVYKIKFNKEEGKLSLFHGTNSYLSWTGIKYVAEVVFEIDNCRKVR